MADLPRRSQPSLPPARRKGSGKKSKRKSTGGFPTGLLIGGAAVILLAGGAFAAFKLLSKPKPGEQPGELAEGQSSLGAPTSGTPAAAPSVESTTATSQGWVDPGPAHAIANVGAMPQPIAAALGTLSVHYLPVPSALAVISLPDANGRPEFRLWDLEAGAQRGKSIAVQENLATEFAASPDGELIGLRPIRKLPPRNPNERERLTSNEIELYAFSSGERLRTIVAEAPEDNLAWAQFGSRDRLITFGYRQQNDARSKHLRVWNPQTGEQLREINWQGHFEPRHVCLSPGGRYLAVYDGFQFKGPLQVFDLENAAAVAALAPEASNAAGERWEWVSLAFSPNGAKLAALRTSQTETELLVVDCLNGQINGSHRLSGGIYSRLPGSYQGRHLEWLADASGWFLVGGLIFDAGTGDVIWEMSTSGTAFPNQGARRVFGSQLVFLGQEDAGPAQRSYSFQAFPITNEAAPAALPPAAN